MEYIDQNGRAQKQTFHELMARVIQHETDHLDGIMIVDHLTDDQFTKLKNKLEAIS